MERDIFMSSRSQIIHYDDYFYMEIVGVLVPGGGSRDYYQPYGAVNLGTRH